MYNSEFKCGNLCIQCDNLQVTKINISQLHGVCQNHQRNDPIHSYAFKCKHCDTLLYFNQLNECQRCENCKGPYDNFQQICRHLICSNCTLSNFNCPLCKVPFQCTNKCNNCLKIAHCYNLFCGHRICHEDFQGICPICPNVRSINSFTNCSGCSRKNYEGREICKKCEECIYCNKEPRAKVFDCGHSICKTCLGDDNKCPLCSFFNNKSVDYKGKDQKEEIKEIKYEEIKKIREETDEKEEIGEIGEKNEEIEIKEIREITDENEEIGEKNEEIEIKEIREIIDEKEGKDGKEEGEEKEEKKVEIKIEEEKVIKDAIRNTSSYSSKILFSYLY